MLKGGCSLRDAVRLMHEGSRALAVIEHNGIRVDQSYLENTIKKITEDLKDREEQLQNTKFWRRWRRVYRDKAKLGNLEQLGELLFIHLKLPCNQRTAPTERYPDGRPKTDETALETVANKVPFVKDYLFAKKLQKVLTTYLIGIQRETVDGFLHPSFNLHLTETFRSSSDSPNFQNMPVRNKYMAELIRRCFIPRKGRRLIEVDYSGIEVRIAACYHNDPVMLRYIRDKSTDMHRDMAMEIYLLARDKVDKMVRYCAKNMFVFPQFYGSYYVDCARNLWEAIDRLHLEVDGMSLKEHLKRNGIHSLGRCDPNSKPLSGTFEHHVQQVEKKFWGERFGVYDQWKRDWWNKFLERGWFDTFTGFRIHGLYRRNQVINYPVQGSAFHCLLQAIIYQLKEIKRLKMKSLVVGQIHDSDLGDVPENEVQDYLDLTREVMVEWVPKLWKWINVPLEIEADVTPMEKSWFEKQEWVEKEGVWGGKT